MLSCETVGWAEACDVISVISEGMYLVSCHIEPFHVWTTTRVLLGSFFALPWLRSRPADPCGFLVWKRFGAVGRARLVEEDTELATKLLCL